MNMGLCNFLQPNGPFWWRGNCVLMTWKLHFFAKKPSQLLLCQQCIHLDCKTNTSLCMQKMIELGTLPCKWDVISSWSKTCIVPTADVSTMKIGQHNCVGWRINFDDMALQDTESIAVTFIQEAGRFTLSPVPLQSHKNLHQRFVAHFTVSPCHGTCIWLEMADRVVK